MTTVHLNLWIILKYIGGLCNIHHRTGVIKINNDTVRYEEIALP